MDGETICWVNLLEAGYVKRGGFRCIFSALERRSGFYRTVAMDGIAIGGLSHGFSFQLVVVLTAATSN